MSKTQRDIEFVVMSMEVRSLRDTQQRDASILSNPKGMTMDMLQGQTNLVSQYLRLEEVCGEPISEQDEQWI